MSVFNVLFITYYIFSAFILVLASYVFRKLLSLSKQIADAGVSKLNFKSEVYHSVESFLLATNPNFPLSALVKILPGTFIGFGILGTFLGFSNGISGMSLTENVEELFGKLDVFLVGLTKLLSLRL